MQRSLEKINRRVALTAKRKNKVATRWATGKILLGVVIIGLSVPKMQTAASGQILPIDPAAMVALNKMGVYLRTLNAFQVQAALTTDDVLDDGQLVESSRSVDLLSFNKNRLRVEIGGDEERRLYLFDGSNFTIWNEESGYYATVSAPSTTAKLIDQLRSKFGIELPLVDLFRWGASNSSSNAVEGAVDVGPSAVGNVSCEQYIFHQEDIDWQVWIQLGDYPLPRKLVITTLSDPAKPRHSETLNWNLAPAFDAAAFTFDPPANAHRIQIAELKGAQNGENHK